MVRNGTSSRTRLLPTRPDESGVAAGKVPAFISNEDLPSGSQKSLEVRSEGAGGHRPSYVMVWWGVSHQGVTLLHFCEKGVNTGALVYQEDVLQGVVKPLNATVFSGQKWVFQQNSVPAHKAGRLRSGCGEGSALYQHRGLALGESRPQPPGLQTVGCLEDMACRKRHNNLDSLKRSLMKAASEIPLETVRAAIAE